MARLTDVRGNVAFVDFGRRGPIMVSKKQLAKAIGRSVRWIEMRHHEGLPSEMRGNKRMYELGEVKAWVDAYDARKESERDCRDLEAREEHARSQEPEPSAKASDEEGDAHHAGSAPPIPPAA